jgi:hypothetical protein
MKATGQDRLTALIQAIREQADFDHPVTNLEIVETHISLILLTGPFAYKFKKALDLGFLDFSTLEKRKFYCEEELRLNRRLAPDLYLAVVPVTGTEKLPIMNGTGEAIEYAVKMVQFSREGELDKMLSSGRLGINHIDEIALKLHTFHNNINVATTGQSYGEPQTILEFALDNLSQIQQIIRQDQAGSLILQQLSAWTMEEFKRLERVFRIRKQEGFVRECHGDMHLENMAMHNNELLIFDCIEFSRSLHWIDTMSEVAFLVMDLDARGHRVFSRRLLNEYLQWTGDYNGLLVFRFYLVYRALIRFKITCIRLQQSDLSATERQQETELSRRYLELARNYIRPEQPILLITHGLSGSGKTTLTQPLLEQLPAIRIRSDIERKRLHGLQPSARTGSGIESGIYTRTDSEQTYARLAELTRTILAAGYSVIVDANFLNSKQRDNFRKIAGELSIPYIILDIQADYQQLRQRIIQRQQNPEEASEANLPVLEYQIDARDPLDAQESKARIVINSSQEVDTRKLLAQIRSVL